MVNNMDVVHKIKLSKGDKFMNYLEIEKVIGREIIDSRGNPTVEAEVYLVDGTKVFRKQLRTSIQLSMMLLLA